MKDIKFFYSRTTLASSECTTVLVVIYCQIVDRKYVRHLAAIYGSNRRCGRPVDKITKYEQKTLSKKINTPLLRPRPELCRGRATTENLTQIFSSSVKIFLLLKHHGHLWSRPKVLLKIFLKIQNSCGRNAELNRF